MLQLFEVVCDELVAVNPKGQVTKFGEFCDQLAHSKGIKDKQLYGRLSEIIEVRPKYIRGVGGSFHCRPHAGAWQP